MTALWFALRFLMPADTPTELMSCGFIAGLAMLSVVPVYTQGVASSFTAAAAARVVHGARFSMENELTRALLLVPFHAAVCGIMGGVVADSKFNLTCCSLLRALCVLFPPVCIFSVTVAKDDLSMIWNVVTILCTVYVLYKNKKWARYFNHIAAIDAMTITRNYGVVADAQVHA
eukprot:GDKI01021215.1.p1 GENE.GDKI01021215.1~~GDKI01021215.1.p1  ORF type:complete len:174 (+),score=24.77 GDKI01021215.1:183-704(+)